MIRKLIIVFVMCFGFTTTVLAAAPELEDLIKEGKKAYAAGSYKVAGTLFNKAIIVAPERADIYLNSAQAWLEQGNSQQALNDLDEYIRLMPLELESYCIRSYVWQVMGEYENALSDVNTALQLQPNSSALYYVRGLVWEAAGEFDKAVKDYTKGLEILKKSAKAKANSNQPGLVTYADLSDVTVYDKNGAALYFHRALAQSKNGNFVAAKKDFKRAIKIDENLKKNLPEDIF